MTTDEIAKGLVALCKEMKFDEAMEKYYSNDIVSIEPRPGEMQRTEGIEAVKGKGGWWMANHEIHSFSTEGPYINGDQFAVKFEIDVTFKPTGQRNKGAEIGVYTVKHGKIIEEVFMNEGL